MAVIADHKNVSDGNLAVCDSIDFAICLPRVPVVLRMHLPCVVSCGSAATNVPDVIVWGRLRFYQHARHWTRFGPSRFRFRNLSRGDCERRSNDLQTIRCADDFAAATARTLETCFRRSDSSWVVFEEGDQAVVTTRRSMLRCRRGGTHGRPESKYIESPDSSACSWRSM